MAKDVAIFAKIAVELREAVARRVSHGAAFSPHENSAIAEGEGWSVTDVTCTYGPHDRPFSEQHDQFSVALVLAGSFQYRGTPGGKTGQLMTPGSLFLGNPSQWFECVHDHGHGDRCLSFHFSPEFFEETAAGTGAKAGERRFRVLRLPALRAMSPVVAQACARLAAEGDAAQADLLRSWEEIAVEIAAASMRMANSLEGSAGDALPSVAARITQAVRMMEKTDEAQGWTLERIANEARLSKYHFLRTFEQVTGLTPHQYLRRLRLRKAATRLLAEPGNVLDVALDCGFGDLSNFNRAFRVEFGMSPRAFRRQGRVIP